MVNLLHVFLQLTTIISLHILYCDSYVINNHRIKPRQLLSYSSKYSQSHLKHTYFRLYNENNLDSTESEQPYNIFNDLRNKLKGTSIYLVGMMGSGKTSVGNEIAQQMGYRFLDTDQIAEFMIEMPISEFFAQGKETEFRQVEYQVLMELSQYMRVIVSTGGGIVLKNENWGLLRHGIVIFLDLSPENIYNRLKSNSAELEKRPLLQSADPLEKLTDLYNTRLEKYMQSDVRIEVNPTASVKQVAVDVAEGIVHFINENPPMWQEWKRKRDSTAVEAAARVSGCHVTCYHECIYNFN